MNIQITCNTEDSILLANVHQNSRLPLRWVKSLPAHDGHAVIVGGGPSVADYLPSIQRRIELGQTVFALNAACGFLNKHGVTPDYQVMLDARPENSNLLGKASEYLLASQCHPALFSAVEAPTLWHAINEDSEYDLPEYNDDYAMIGGGTVVGLSAMALAYTLGYRKLHLYGYDSSHREKAGHAYEQPLNAQDPICKVTLGGQTFTSSLAMAAQAERFPVLCNSLIDLGCVITVDSDGLIMAVIQEMKQKAEPLTEDEKYRKMWALPAYRDMSPGEGFASEFVRLAQITKETSVIDFGCGTGRGGKAIHELTGCSVVLTDFADNCLDEDTKLPFVVSDLAEPMGLRADVGYCTDVMEHIPPDQVHDVIENIMECVDRCFFKIAMFPDNMGALIGQPLHLSVFPLQWWVSMFAGYEILYAAGEELVQAPYATIYVKSKGD